jgi:dTDP-4-dehydrorhamnose 3,5-epimerase
MQIEELGLRGVYRITPRIFSDHRGDFVKSFHEPTMRAHGLTIELREEFFSISHRGVLRGMHFQVPPSDHQKFVYCTNGTILDVLVDLRKGESTYGRSISLTLDGTSREIVWIPKGIAHGFVSLSDQSCVIYKTDREHVAQDDRGIHWDSFGFEWPLPKDQLIVSERDQQHPRLDQFPSPF